MGRRRLSWRVLVARRKAVAPALRAQIIGEYLAAYGRNARGVVAAKYDVLPQSVSNWIRRGEVGLTSEVPSPPPAQPHVLCAFPGCDEYPGGVILCARCGASYWCIPHLLWARKREQGRRHMLDTAAAYVLRPVVNVCPSRAEIAAEVARLADVVP